MICDDVTVMLHCGLWGGLKWIKARRDMYGATGHAHINTVCFLSLCTTIIIKKKKNPVRGKFRVGVGIDVNKTQSNR